MRRALDFRHSSQAPSPATPPPQPRKGQKCYDNTQSILRTISEQHQGVIHLARHHPKNQYALSPETRTHVCVSLREKCPYSELLWSAFSRIRTEYGEWQIRALFTQCIRGWKILVSQKMLRTHYVYDRPYIPISSAYHCVKTVQIRSYFWFVFCCIRTEYRKIRKYGTEITLHLDPFHAVYARIYWPDNILYSLVYKAG